ncbi:MAG: lipid-binding SYLF domain-containing protein [Candidatus Omnitrophota bacterium]
MRVKSIFVALIVFGFAIFALTGNVLAWSAAEIDTGVVRSLGMLKDIGGGAEVLKKAEGVLVFPAVFKAGIGLGGEYGEGALVIKGKTVDYYSTAAASIGFQLGAQKKTIILAFMDKAALEGFRNSDGWKVGADASVTVIAVGADGSIDTAKTNKPIVAFVFDQKGLMYNLTLEGAKITKLKR